MELELDIHGRLPRTPRKKWAVRGSLSPDAIISQSADGTRLRILGYQESMVVITTGDSFFFRDKVHVLMGTAMRAKVNAKGKLVWEVRLYQLVQYLLLELGDEGFKAMLERQEPYKVGSRTIQPRTTMDAFDPDHDVFLTDDYMDVEPSLIIKKATVLDRAEAQGWYHRHGMKLPGLVFVATMKFHEATTTIKPKRQRVTTGIEDTPVSGRVTCCGTFRPRWQFH
jgi:hypothetical protein